jgi:hypothetical protein
MKPDPLDYLEREIDQELKSLPDLEAPPTLLPGVLTRIQSPAPALASRQLWQCWSLPLRVVVLVVLTGLFALLCVGGVHLAAAVVSSPLAEQGAAWLESLATLLNTVNVLLQTGYRLVRGLGWGPLYGAFAALALGYAMCLLLAAVYVRLAFARQRI